MREKKPKNTRAKILEIQREAPAEAPAKPTPTMAKSMNTRYDATTDTLWLIVISPDDTEIAMPLDSQGINNLLGYLVRRCPVVAK